MDEEIRFFNKNNKPKKLKSILADIYEDLKELIHMSNTASAFIPFFFILTGVTLVLFQFRTEIIQVLNSSLGLINQGNTSPVSGNFFQIEQYISIPTGLTELTQQAVKTNILKIDEESLNYDKPFYISIPSINIYSLPVKPNVESSTESVYKEVLEYSLAHFRNTGLPISKVKNNMVIYGHSASLNYQPRRNDPRVAFSFLPEVKIGDKIYIDIAGKNYEYTISKTKVVNPDETSIITGTPEQQTLTLFTCYPIGNNTQRFVIIARQSS